MQTPNFLQLNPEDLNQLLESYDMRREFVRQFGMLGFGIVYLPHYFYLPPADFHQEIIDTIEDKEKDLVEIIGWRGCAKSVLGSLVLPIYAAVEKPNEYAFILPIADTGVQAAINIANIKEEFENNELLLQDYGRPKVVGAVAKRKYAEGQFVSGADGIVTWTLESEEDWQAKNMLLTGGVRILARSRGQKIRGLRHRQHRPKLAIVDDPEDLEWVRMKENRDKTERWFTGELLPAMDEASRKVILLGNWLHRDALMARMKNRGRFHVLEYPLFNKDGSVSWKAKYPSAQKIEDKKIEMGVVAWQREMLLKIIPEEGQIVKESWIQYYNSIPERVYDPVTRELISNPILSAAVGNDLAISKKEGADFTTFVPGINATQESTDDAGNSTTRQHIFVLPNPVNERLSFQETIARARVVNTMVSNKYAQPIFFMEDVAYQRVAIEMVQAAGIPAQPVKIGTDKRARLMLTAPFIQDGTVLFPRHGCEDLIAQLLGFGVEEHDDLVDGFIQLVLGINNISGMQPLEVITLL